MILRSLPIVATPYVEYNVGICIGNRMRIYILQCENMGHIYVLPEWEDVLWGGYD